MCTTFPKADSALALAEMAVRSQVGFQVEAADVFAESPSACRVSVPAENLREVHRRHVDAGVDAVLAGEAGGDRLVVEAQLDLALDDAIAAWRDRIPDALGAGTAQS